MDVLSLAPLAEELFEQIRSRTFDGVGVTRESYGAGESAAADCLREFATAHGLQADADRAANVVFRLPGAARDRPVAWIGSHIDSVPQGGNFDGLAGVIAGLLCLVARRNAGLDDLPVEVLAFRGEESAWFGKAYLGSGALLGKLAPADLELKRRDSGASLRDCLREAGADVQAIGRQRPLFDASRVKAYLELHIEQGPVMVARDIPLAVVSGIRGNVRHNRITCHGEAQHSGVVPRGLRKDAMFAVADLIMRIDGHWRELLDRGADLVVTTGIVTTDPAEHSISRIPGHVCFSLEARSESADMLEAFYQVVQAECHAIERERGVRFEPDRRLLSLPATMDEHVRAVLCDACGTVGTEFAVIPSGAGHDAAQFANAGIPSGMLFVRNRNGSHNPRESMDIEDFMLGVQAMSHALDRLA